MWVLYYPKKPPKPGPIMAHKLNEKYGPWGPLFSLALSVPLEILGSFPCIYFADFLCSITNTSWFYLAMHDSDLDIKFILKMEHIFIQNQENTLKYS